MDAASVHASAQTSMHGMDDRDMLYIRRLLWHALLALLLSSARELTNLKLPGMLDLTIIWS
jgi:hypothetical protein